MRATNLRTVTYLVRFYDGPTTRILEKRIKGISVNMSEHAEHAIFYIMDEFNQDAFCIPAQRLVDCVQIGAERKPRKPARKPTEVLQLKQVRA